MPAHRRVILTGGPGAGKTTVLRRLLELGYAIEAETARQLIADRQSRGLSPRPNPTDFANAILEQDIQHYEAATGEITFFDRGVLDALVMLRECNALSDKKRDEMVAGFSYSNPVFLFPPWSEIYANDPQRDQTFEEASRISSTINDWYRECGYEICLVPFGSVDQRCAHILKVLGEQV